MSCRTHGQPTIYKHSLRIFPAGTGLASCSFYVICGFRPKCEFESHEEKFFVFLQEKKGDRTPFLVISFVNLGHKLSVFEMLFGVQSISLNTCSLKIDPTFQRKRIKNIITLANIENVIHPLGLITKLTVHIISLQLQLLSSDLFQV